MSLVSAVCPDIFSQLSYQANPQGRVAAFLQAHHHVWVSRAPGRAFTYWRLNTSIYNHWKHWAQLGAIKRWIFSVLSQRAPPCIPPVSALTAAMDRVSTPPLSPASSTSTSPIIMRAPWQQAFYEEYGMDYESDFEQGGGPFNPGCTHPWEISSSSSSSSAEWVFDRRDHTTPPPSRRRSSPPESPPRRRVTDVDRNNVSPQLMSYDHDPRRGNSTTVSCRPSLRKPSRRGNCVVTAQSNAPSKRPAPKPRPTGKQYVQALRNKRSATRGVRMAQPTAPQRTYNAQRANCTTRGTASPVPGKWVFIPNKRETRTKSRRSAPNGTKSRRSAPNETATSSYLAAQATAVLMFLIFIAKMCIYAREPAQHSMN